MTLDGKVSLITGAARGQGEAEARIFLDRGARVVLADVLDAEGEAVAKELGDGAVYVHLDVTSEDEWASAVATAERTFGRLDVLVNNAGILKFGPVDAMPLRDYEAVIRVNQIGTFLGMRASAPAMKRAGGGSIVNVASIEGIVGMPGLIAYAASKGAVRAMTKVAAAELGPHGIRVNSVHPGGVDTPMSRPAGMSKDVMAPLFRRIPLGRVGEAEEIARVVAFLASDEASYCTGSEFVVDGGAVAKSILDPGGL